MNIKITKFYNMFSAKPKQWPDYDINKQPIKWVKQVLAQYPETKVTAIRTSVFNPKKPRVLSFKPSDDISIRALFDPAYCGSYETGASLVNGTSKNSNTTRCENIKIFAMLLKRYGPGSNLEPVLRKSKARSCR